MFTDCTRRSAQTSCANQRKPVQTCANLYFIAVCVHTVRAARTPVLGLYLVFCSVPRLQEYDLHGRAAEHQEAPHRDSRVLDPARGRSRHRRMRARNPSRLGGLLQQSARRH